MEDSHDEIVEALRRQNRTLRKMNKILRSDLKDSREYADNLFLELCVTKEYWRQDTET